MHATVSNILDKFLMQLQERQSFESNCSEVFRVCYHYGVLFGQTLSRSKELNFFINDIRKILSLTIYTAVIVQLHVSCNCGFHSQCLSVIDAFCFCDGDRLPDIKKLLLILATLSVKTCTGSFSTLWRLKT